MGSWDVNRQWTFNPANQAVTEALDNALYPWTGHPAGVSQVTYTADGLNRITAASFGANSNAYSYDANGNLTSDSLTTYVYDVENRLVSASGQNTASLRYDPFGRLHEVIDWQGSVRRFLYDGDALVGEYGPTGTLLARHVHGVGAGDDPLITYPGASTSYLDAEYLYTDRLGSVIARYRRDGSATAINGYDEYGVPGPSTGVNNNGRFRYTGQVWLPELGLYYYKARMYSPTIGRFMQTDPIGYADGMNMYAYVGNDPVNGVDPTGLCGWEDRGHYIIGLTSVGDGPPVETKIWVSKLVVTGCLEPGGGQDNGGGGGGDAPLPDCDKVLPGTPCTIVVKAKKSRLSECTGSLCIYSDPRDWNRPPPMSPVPPGPDCLDAVDQALDPFGLHGTDRDFASGAKAAARAQAGVAQDMIDSSASSFSNRTGLQMTYPILMDIGEAIRLCRTSK